MSESTEFTFIVDPDLRRSLTDDYRELQSCLESGAWKAAHVLSGSIVEAILVDYLLTAGYSERNPLSMSLDDLITSGKELGVLTEKTADLSSVVRRYRNLIHPGRVLRLQETVDQEGASIANSLVAIIVREVAAKQVQVRGFTAEQLLAKFEGDPLAVAISDHLLRDARPEEIERLLVSTLPERYFVIMNEDPEVLTRLGKIYLDAYTAAPESVQKVVAMHFVNILKTEVGWRVSIYEERFFVGYFLEHLSESDRTMVKDHLFARLKDGVSDPKLMSPMKGMSSYLTENEVDSFFDPLIQTISYWPFESAIESATELLLNEYFDYLPLNLEAMVRQRLDQWIQLHKENKRLPAVEKLEAILAILNTSDTPK